MVRDSWSLSGILCGQTYKGDYMAWLHEVYSLSFAVSYPVFLFLSIVCSADLSCLLFVVLEFH